MAKHEIALAWKSAINGDDEDGFDLQNLNEFGTNVKQCKHGAHFIHDGLVTAVTSAVLPGGRCYLVRFDEPPNMAGGFQLQYRGIAIQSPTDGQFHKIVGIKKKALLTKAQSKTAEATEDVALALGGTGQDEGTWTGTQP